MATSNQQYVEEIALLQERFPQEEPHKLFRILKRHNGDVEMVRALLYRDERNQGQKKLLEQKYGELADRLQKDEPAAAHVRRQRLIKLLEDFDGQVELVRKFLNSHIKDRHEKHHEKQHDEHHEKHQDKHDTETRQERLAALRSKYEQEISQIGAAGFDVEHPRIARQLMKHNGDVQAVIAKLNEQKMRHKDRAEFQSKYFDEINQLKGEGVEIKNDRVLARLLNKADGDVNFVKQLIDQRKEKHRLRKEYQQRHATYKQENSTEQKSCRKRRELSVDDRENLKRLRAAGVHGNPRVLLEILRECDGSIESAIERAAKRHENRKELRTVHECYTPLMKHDDWPENIEEVYLDGNNMMFVVDSLRKLCLNHASHKTERAIADIAAAWNDHMRIPQLHLIFDSTKQTDPVGSVIVRSARPKYQTTDEMLVDIVRQTDHQPKNRCTVVVTSDRALALSLKNEGCKLVKPYHWFAHCMMILTPDLVNINQATPLESSSDRDPRSKTRYQFDELVQRVAKISL